MKPGWNWNLSGAVAETLVNLAGTLRERCWKGIGTFLEPSETLLQRDETLLEPCCWNLWLEHFAGGQCGCRFRFSFHIAFALFLALLTVPGCDVEVWLELCWNRVAALQEPV